MSSSLVSSPFLILLSALLMAVAWLVPLAGPLNSLGWVILIRMAIVRNRKSAGWVCGLCGLIHLLIAFHWAGRTIYETTNLGVFGSIAGLILFLVWESVPFSVFGLAASTLWRRGPDWIFLLVPIWILAERLWPKVFAWSIAHTYLDYPPVIQLAEVAGASAVAALVMLFNVAAAYGSVFVWPDRMVATSVTLRWTSLAAASSLVVACLIWGAVREHRIAAMQTTGARLRVAIVQVDPTVVGAIERLRELSDSVEGPVDLFVWPESALGIYHSALQDFRDQQRTTELSEAPNPALDPYSNNRAYLLAGGKTYDEGGRDRGPYRNCAFLINSEKQIVGRTSKRTLMPIGEYVPLERLVPWFREWLAVDTDLIPGVDFSPLELANGIKLGVTVCYEDTDPAIASANVRSGADVLIGLINASAFTSPTTLQQHLRLARLRAVENRTWFLRCSSTGITCVIDPNGRLAKQLPCGVEAVLVAEIPCNL
ncbi:MAG: apolipoprotein N-acyltransferase [Phycisphaera sp. RhM]|nr:apolipoprotein N-acyltransferase [Phycisphaera sp. RhM]